MDLTIDPTSAFATVLVPIQILVVDLLLSADNALLIALACRGLAPAEMQKAALFGTFGAICLRIAMGSVTLILMRVPYLRIAAGIVLVYISIRLTLDQDDAETLAALRSEPLTEDEIRRRNRANLLGAIWAIIVADATMSLDNVVAVAAVAQDSVILLGLGLLMSIPMLVWGSTLIRTFLDQNPYLVLWSGAFLGWIAGGIAVSDPMVAPVFQAYAPALPIVVPVACAVFVIWQSWILGRYRSTSGGSNEP